MKPRHLAWLAFKNLGRHAFRSFLTVLGIVFGVGSLVAMLSITEGARRKAMEEMASLAVENIIVESSEPTGGETAGKNGRHVIYGLTDRDKKAFEGFHNVRNIVSLRDCRQSIYHKGEKTTIGTVATDPEFKSVGKLKLLEGRFICDADNEKLNRVCVLGTRAADTLFPGQKIGDMSVLIGSTWFDVVGRIEAPSMMRFGFSGDLNNAAFMPRRTADARFGETAFEVIGGGHNVNSTTVAHDALILQTSDLESISHTANRAKRYLMSTHEDADYNIIVPLDLVRQKEASQRIFSIVMATIASISLIVGGTGVTNIMMANIYERTHEIGISMATGARRNDILKQFLIEAVSLSLLGGVMGLLLGVGIAQGVAHFAKWQTTVTPLALAGALIISAVIGLAAGTYPAYRASRLSPITALRTK